MKRLFGLIQFLPLSVFLTVARTNGLTPEAWQSAFIWGGIAGAIELAILIPLMGSRLNRLIISANLFLIFGGVSFYFNLSSLLDLLGTLRESGVLIFLILVCAFSIWVSPSGVFEQPPAGKGQERKYSFIYLAGAAVAFLFSFANRGNTTLAGVVPFVCLILFKVGLQKKLSGPA